MDKKDYDAVVVGSGPNGPAAGILLQQKGLSVLLIEGKREIGGGLSSRELTLPGFIHDTCSAIHPLAAGSPFFTGLPLEVHGLQFVYPAIDAAHPFDEGRAAFLIRSIENPNYIGGNINGGAFDLCQLFTRALRLSPYGTSAKGIYVCSSSTRRGRAFMACAAVMGHGVF